MSSLKCIYIQNRTMACWHSSRTASSVGRHDGRAANKDCCWRHVACSAQATESMPSELRKIVGAFKMVPDAMSRYKQLLFFASKLQGLDDSYKVEAFKVHGCVSQVWVVPELRDGKMYWKADSDAQLTKGLAALLVNGLSGSTPEEVATVEPDFIEDLGIKQALTPSRNNGFLNMFQTMKRQAAAHTSTGISLEDGMVSEVTRGGAAESRPQVAGELPDQSKRDVPRPAATSSSWEPTPECPKPVASSMAAKLNESLKPVELEVVDESVKHAGHAGARGVDAPSGETHFRVRLVSEQFEGLSAVQRHKAVFGVLAEELKGPVHALSIDAKAPSEV